MALGATLAGCAPVVAGALAAGGALGSGSGGGTAATAAAPAPPNVAPSFDVPFSVRVDEDAGPTVVSIDRVTAGSAAEDAAGQAVSLQVTSSDEEVFFARSADGAATWSPNALISAGRQALSPAIATSPGATVCVWLDGPAREVHFARTTDSGASFLRTRVSDDVSSGRFDPTVAVEPGGAIVVAWGDLDTGVRFTRSTDAGATWSPSVSLETGARDTRIATEPGGAIVLGWTKADYYRGDVLHVARSTDGGATWSTILELVDSRTESIGPSTSMRHLAVGPGGHIGCVGSNFYWRQDVVFVRGLFKP